jgi:hypothetical protein
MSQISFAQVLELNRIDSLGLKQGKWEEFKLIPSKVIVDKILKDSIKGIQIINDYNLIDNPVIFVAQGQYLNGLKTGIWTEYWKNDSVRSRVSYLNGVAFGEFKIFYPNGNLMMEGIITYSKFITAKMYNKQGELIGIENKDTISILEYIYLK